MLFAQCQHKEISGGSTNPLDQFSVQREVHIEGIDIPLENDSVLYDPRTIDIHDSIAILYDNVGTTGYTMVNLKNGKLLKRFAYSGDKSTQFNINALNVTFSDDHQSILIYQANPPARLFRYSIDSLMKLKDYQPEFMYEVPKQLYFDNLLALSDSLLIGKLGMISLDSKLFGLLDIKTNKMTTGILLPKLNDVDDNYYSKDVLPWTRSTLDGKTMLRPGRPNEVAYFSSKGGFAQILNISKGSHFNSAYQMLSYLPSFEVLKTNDMVSTKLSADCLFGYNDVAVTSDEIFVLYNGKNATDEGTDNLSSNILLVYDWHGKPLRRYKLDKDCYKIAIDPGHPKILYTLQAFKNIKIRTYKL